MDQTVGSTTEYNRGWVGQGEENAFVTSQIRNRESESKQSPPALGAWVNVWTGKGKVVP